MLRKSSLIFDRIIGLPPVVAAALVPFMMLAVTYEIVIRYFKGVSQIWVGEISGYCLLFITFASATWLLKREKHIKVELVLNRMSPRIQTLLNILTSAIGAAICCALTWYGSLATFVYWQKGIFIPTLLEVPTEYVLVIIPVGSFFLFIQFMRRTYGHLESWKSISRRGPRLQMDSNT